jgi:hypothetical protein
MKRHLVTFLFLVIAIAFYSMGAVGPGTLLLFLGVIAEGVFWYRLFGRRKRTQE